METKTKKEEQKKLLPYHPKAGDKIVLISAMMQTCIAEFVDEDDQYYIVKNPMLFATFPERSAENPNQVRTRVQAPCLWTRAIMADINIDQYTIFPKATFGVMFVNDATNAPLFSTDVTRIYNGTWGKPVEEAKPESAPAAEKAEVHSEETVEPDNK